MNKKIVIISIVILAIVVLAGFFVYSQVVVAPGPTVENTDDTELSGIEVEAGPANGGNGNGGGGLVICADKCGDGVCQSAEEKCDGINCVCPENNQECPQDCK